MRLFETLAVPQAKERDAVRRLMGRAWPGGEEVPPSERHRCKRVERMPNQRLGRGVVILVALYED